MEHVRMNDRDYLDLGEDSGSDKGNDSSDDDIEVILHGTPEQKRKLRDRIMGSSESDSEFETEMNSELERRVQALASYHKVSPGQVRGEKKKDVTVDSQEVDSDDDINEPKISNDELFYDPEMDDDDQKWVDSQRRQNRSQKSSATSVKKAAAANSDAILDCPACLTTLCIDCQRHTIYHNQYRAMFVMNCVVDRTQISSYPEQSRKRGKKGKNKSNTIPTKQGKVSERTNVDNDVLIETDSGEILCTDKVAKNCVERSHKISQSGEKSELSGTIISEVSETVTVESCVIDEQSHEKANIDRIVVQERLIEDTCIPKSKNVGNSENKETFTSSENVNIDMSVELQKDDDFYSVNCSVCNTAVAVLDNVEVYHFYNVIAAYT